MKNTLLVAVSATLALGAAAAPQKKQHVPDRLDGIRLINRAASEKNHVLIVNVGGAIPSEDWGDVVTYAASRLQINVWTNSADKIDIAAYALSPAKVQQDFGDKAKVCVFMIDDPRLASITGAPGCWCAMNLCNVKRDNPDRQTQRDRYAKMILRGLAYGGGAGVSLEPMCSLFYGGITLGGMDKTGIMISPATYFPMLEVFRAVGGGEMLTPAMD